jgi:hypothetical protein
LAEEIDVFYCRAKQADFLSETFPKEEEEENEKEDKEDEDFDETASDCTTK